MTTCLLRRALPILAMLAAPGLVLAARPMLTDDARIVDPQSCQVESCVRANHEGPAQAWAVPGCNPPGNPELSVGGSAGRADGERRLSNSLVQAKTMLKPLRTNGWGLALTLGRSLQRGLEPGSSDAPSHYLNVPLSFSLRDDALVLHLNGGLREDRLRRQTFATWGLGSELQLRDRLQLITELYGESRSRPFLHGGLRYWVVPERVQIDTTYGTEARSGTQQRWFSVGLRLLSPAFLP